jgi:hypothetical protein
MAKFWKKWTPDIDLSDPAGWKTVGVSSKTWSEWRRGCGVPRAYLEWEDRDWFSEAQELVEQGRVRHLGDLCLQLGVPHETVKTWAKRYRHQCGLYELIGELPRPGGYYSSYAVHVTRPVIRMFNASRRRLIADGVDELEATHEAADVAVAKFRTIARARRKVRREAKYGPDTNIPHRLTKAEAKRIAWELRAELGRLRIERIFEEQGYTPDEIAELMPKPRAKKETTAERAKRKGWSAGREATVVRAEHAALEIARGMYGKPSRFKRRKRSKPHAVPSTAISVSGVPG